MANGFLTRFIVTHADIRTSISSSSAPALPSTYNGTFLYRPFVPKNNRTHDFGNMLSPVTSSAQNHLTSELLRTL